jgi:hypothetical protein
MTARGPLLSGFMTARLLFVSEITLNANIGRAPTTSATLAHLPQQIGFILDLIVEMSLGQILLCDDKLENNHFGL